jgi:hypothetical protein
MIMDYLGIEVPQWKQVNDELGDCSVECARIPRPSPCTAKRGTPIFKRYGFCSFNKIRETIKRDERYEYVDHEHLPLLWEELVYQIECDRPFYFSWLWHEGGGHGMVARGYIQLDGEKLVVVNDPVPKSRYKWEGGSIRIISYRDYVQFEPLYGHSKDIFFCPVRKIVSENIRTTRYEGQSVASISPGEAAKKSLRLLQKLPAEFKELLGFKPEHMDKELSLKEKEKSIKVYTVGSASLEEYKEEGDPNHILKNAYQLIYPVYMDEELVSSITIREREGKWTFAMFGGKEIESVKNAWEEYRDRYETFLVQVPAMYRVFLGYRRPSADDGPAQLNLIDVRKHPGEANKEVKSPAPKLAEDVFKQLSKQTEKYKIKQSPDKR